jgi:hypothetical protein
MQGSLTKTLADSGITTANFAKLVRVTTRAVNLWLSGEREIPGPVTAYLDLFVSLPKAIRAQELARIREEKPSMYEGMYSIQFRGQAGVGLGVLVLMAGRVFGSDGGVAYDGHYEPSKNRKGYLDVTLKITVPAGVALVQGVASQPAAYWFDLQASFHAQDNTSLKVETPYGPVHVTVTYLRGLPVELAA